MSPVLQQSVTGANVPVSAAQRLRIVDIITDRHSEHSGLAADGFECLTHSTNAGTWFGRSQFVWVRRSCEAPERHPVVDVVVAVGDGMAPFR